MTPRKPNSAPDIAWTHDVHAHMDCPDDGEMSETQCRHIVDLTSLRQRAQDYIESFGAGNWARGHDVWVDLLRPAAGARDAVLMGRYIFAVSPDAVLALLDELERLQRVAAPARVS